MERLKRGGRLAAPLLVVPVCFLIYAPVNRALILPWLGCSCPVIDAAGNLVPRGFCANHFTLIVCMVLTIGALALAAANLKLYRRWAARLTYLGGCTIGILLTARWFVLLQYWR